MTEVDWFVLGMAWLSLAISWASIFRTRRTRKVYERAIEELLRVRNRALN